MADKQKYYYLKIKENFFDSEDMKLLESMNNGYLYSNILMKMYLLSLKNGGKLMYKDKIPYNSKMLSTILNHNVDILDKAINIFKELNLIEILDSGAIFMLDIQNYIGRSSDEADRIREYRSKINNEKTNLLQMYDKSTTNCANIKDRDKDKDINRDRVIEKEKEKNKKNSYGTFKRIKLTDKEYNKLVEDFSKEFIDNQIKLLDEYVESNNNKNKYTNFNLVLRKSIRENWFNKQKGNNEYERKIEKDKDGAFRI